MATGLQRRIEAWAQTLHATGSMAKAAASFIYPSTMTWSGRAGGGFISMAPRNHPWRNIDPLDNSAVMNCIAWICRNFGQGVLQTVREQRDGSLKAIDTPGFLDLVYKPNPHHTAMQFWAGTLLSYWTGSDAYWIKVRSARGFGTPTELWYEPHWSMAPHWPADGSVFIDYYERRVNGRVEQIPVENVVHFRNGLNPANPRFGLSPLKTALLEVFTDQEAAAYTAALLKNMAIPGVVVTPSSPVGFTPEKMEQMLQKYKQKFGGDNRGEPLFLDYESTVTTIGFSPSEMDFTEVRRIGEERISGCFGLPAIVAGLGAGLDASTYNNLKELKKSAFEDCLSPMWDSIAETLTNQLLPDFSEDEDLCADFDLSQIAALKEDEDKANLRMLDRVKNGVITINEARVGLGYKPAPGADYLMIPNNARPATIPVAVARAGQEIEDPKPAQPGVTDDRDEGGGKRLPPSLQPIVITLRAEPEPLLLTDGSKKKAYEWLGMKLRRKPTPLEQIIDIKQIDTAMALGASSFGGLLMGLRSEWVREAIDALEGLDPERYHELILAVDEDDAGEIAGMAGDQYLIGAELIAEELQRQSPEIGGVVVQLIAEAAAAQLASLAQVTVSRLANDVQSRVIAAAQQATLLGVSDVAGFVGQSMADGSKAYVDRAARAMANTSLASGRRAEIQARPEDIRLVVYSAVLDANTCEPCGEADGETGTVEEITSVPNPKCPGGGECRCVHIAISELSNVQPQPGQPARTGAEARAEIAAIRQQVIAETEARRQERDALTERWRNAATEAERQEIGNAINALNRSQESERLNALERYRGILYQDSKAAFTVDKPADINQFAERTIDEGADAFARFVGAGKLDGERIKFTVFEDRSYFNGRTGVHLNVDADPEIVAHELGHWLELRSDSIRQEVLDFYNRRTAGDAPEKLSDLTGNSDYGAYEIAKRDKWTDVYIGKVYADENGNQILTEVLAVGLQWFYEKPQKFAEEDPEFFDFIYDLLRK